MLVLQHNIPIRKFQVSYFDYLPTAFLPSPTKTEKSRLQSPLSCGQAGAGLPARERLNSTISVLSAWSGFLISVTKSTVHVAVHVRPTRVTSDVPFPLHPTKVLHFLSSKTPFIVFCLYFSV